MSDKELIKQEIGRLYKHYLDAQEFDSGYNMALDNILQFIESLPEEPKCIYNRTLDERKKFCKYCSAACDVRIEEEPASEDKSEKELAETYLAVFDKKYPILPTLKGKQKADFKNFLNKCQQEFGLKEFGIHPTQSKLFEKLTLLWATWGAEHLEGLGKSNQDEFDKELPSDDLNEAAKQHSKQTFNGLLIEDNIDAFIAGAEWQKQKDLKRSIEKNKFKSTTGYIELEKEIDKVINTPENQGNPELRKEMEEIARHFSEWQRQRDFPTKDITDSAMYWCGYKDCKEKMMEKAVDADIVERLNDNFNFTYKVKTSDYFDIPNAELGGKVKIIIIDEKFGTIFD